MTLFFKKCTETLVERYAEQSCVTQIENHSKKWTNYKNCLKKKGTNEHKYINVKANFAIQDCRMK